MGPFQNEKKCNTEGTPALGGDSIRPQAGKAMRGGVGVGALTETHTNPQALATGPTNAPHSAWEPQGAPGKGMRVFREGRPARGPERRRVPSHRPE